MSRKRVRTGLRTRNGRDRIDRVDLIDCAAGAEIPRVGSLRGGVFQGLEVLGEKVPRVGGCVDSNFQGLEICVWEEVFVAMVAGW